MTIPKIETPFTIIPKKGIIHLLLLIISLLFCSCSQSTKTKLFYLNTENSKLIDTVKYNCIENGDTQLWVISKNHTNTLLKTKRFNSNNQPIDEITENITENGSELISYAFVIYGDEFPQPIEFYPKQQELIKWDLNEKSVYSGEFIYNNLIYNFERSRIFLKRHKDTLIFQEKFHIEPIEGQLDNKQIQHSKQVQPAYDQSFTQTSYFKKNAGLVKYYRIYQNREKRTYLRLK